ncbi:MAG: phage tail tip lysozyme [Lachnospiraceae bacterium]|nr:phage tail tip lysozyme [Lachnospiraceae bacterium]
MATMKSKTFVEKAIDIAKNYNTLYVMGCFGAPLTGSNVSRYCTNHTYNKQSTRTAMIKAVADKDPPYYGFDCVCLIKGILWGWSGNSAKTYGGATYASNGVPDISADSMITKCSDISTTGWANMTPGEVCWLSGHIGIYIGDGLCVECTPSWDNKVQITAVKNIGTKSGYNARTWTKHGKLPYVDYSDQATTSSSASSTSTSSSTKAAASSTADSKTIWDYLMGKIGNAYGVAGLMGNLYAESGLIPNNLQNTYNTKLGYTDAAYTAAVDDGSYSNFSSDSAGYGLAQWTYSTRKKNLKAYADAQNASIGNLEMQLGFLYKELSESYSSVLTTLKNATTVLQASNAVLTKFECPADQGSSVKSTRASYGQKYYDTYAGTESSTTDSSSSTSSSTSTTSSTTTYKLAAAQSFDKSLAGTYTTKGAYNMRYVPGTLVSANVICVIPKGKTVRCYGYYTTVSGTKWLYVVYDGKTGFVTMEGLK